MPPLPLFQYVIAVFPSFIFPDDRCTAYRVLRFGGVRKAPLNVCTIYGRNYAGLVVIGRTHVKTMDIYSSICVVESHWSVERAEGLCIGYVRRFHERSEFERVGWLTRLWVEELIYFDAWVNVTATDPLLGILRCPQAAV